MGPCQYLVQTPFNTFYNKNFKKVLKDYWNKMFFYNKKHGNRCQKVDFNVNSFIEEIRLMANLALIHKNSAV